MSRDASDRRPFCVEIYRGEELELVETRRLADVLRQSLGPLFQRDLSGASFYLLLHPIPEPMRLHGTPTVDNLMSDYGYATVLVIENGLIIYRHPHPMEELISRPLQREMRDASPQESLWGYRIVGPGIPDLAVRRAPDVVGAMHVEPYEENEGPSFRVRALPEPEPPAGRLEEFAVRSNSDGQSFVKVLVRDDVANSLRFRRQFSDQVEEGGFLVGHVFRDADHPGTYLTEVTGALPAQHTGASLLHFTFTGDSFQDVKQRLRARRGEVLLGWYHTHLFPASEEMGLSSIDLDLHFTTFRKPWQLAGLINFERDGRRVLRFYVRHENSMALCPQWQVEGRREDFR